MSAAAAAAAAEDLPPFQDAGAGVSAAVAEYYDDDEQKIGSVLMEDGGAGADIWAFFEGEETYLEFRGWRSDGSWWSVECNVHEGIEQTLKVVCQAASDLEQAPPYIRVTSVVYNVEMPDCTMTRAATINQCMDFPSQRWVDVRDQDQWYDVHMVLRVC